MRIYGSMKTTVDIPEQELETLMRFTQADTKRQAIIAAITDYNRRQKMAELTKYLGTCQDLPSLEELREQRQAGNPTF